MTKTVMMFIGFLLILPILPWLPLGISLKGKLIIALESFAIAGAIMMTIAYLPLWQGVLIGLLIFIMVGYLTLKYGLPVWSAEAIHLEETEDKETDFNGQTIKRLQLPFFKKNVSVPPEQMLIHTDEKNKGKPDSFEKKQDGSVENSQGIDTVSAADHAAAPSAEKIPVEDVGKEVVSNHEQDDPDVLKELTWSNEAADRGEITDPKREDEPESDLEELDLLFSHANAEDKHEAEEAETEPVDENEDDWLEVLSEAGEKETTVNNSGTLYEVDEKATYLQKLFSEESASLDEKEAIESESVGFEETKEKTINETLEDSSEEMDELDERYLNDLFKEELDSETETSSEEEDLETIKELEEDLVLEYDDSNIEQLPADPDGQEKLSETSEESEELPLIQKDRASANSLDETLEDSSEEMDELDERYLNDLFKEELDSETETSSEEDLETIKELEEDLVLEYDDSNIEQLTANPDGEEKLSETSEKSGELPFIQKDHDSANAFLEEDIVENDNDETLPHETVDNEPVPQESELGETEQKQEPERSLLSPDWLHIIVQEIAIKQKVLPYSEAEELMLSYLKAPLHDRDYYVIARMLLAFYVANDEPLQAIRFADQLMIRLQAYSVLIEEIKSIKEMVTNQTMKTGERDEEKQ
ncbi:hypothetical protein [Domibacillus tundrae]|uniref:hypothetical protein n=1 Tax=Domibacillus tundrae TaxID=1587527 RepID=UPI000617E6FD|nr:hypothetical protein [Domibacillus tundrae]